MKKFLFCILLFPLLALCEEIIVRLESEVQLLPLYLAPWKIENSALSIEDQRALEKVLTFDLSHNGMTKLAPRAEGLDKLAMASSTDLSSWLQQRVYFVVLPTLKGSTLSARVGLVNTNRWKIIEGIELKGPLAHNRRLVHTLADAIHQALFDVKGIASTRILYTLRSPKEQGKGWNSEIYEMDYDGAHSRAITKNGGYCVTPVYIPPKPGSRASNLLYVSYKIGQPKLFLTSTQNFEPQRISLLRGNQLMPSISQQKDKIAFICDVTGNPDLFLQDFDPEKGPIGKPRQIFSTHKATQGSPSFSPDGKKLAFVSNKDGSARIYIIDIPAPHVSLKQVKAKLISRANRENSAPTWSPDGTKIAFCSMTQGSRQIWIYDCATDREYPLTQGGGHKENPTWAPNSLHLAFNSTGPSGSEIFLINLHQPQAVQITSGPGEKHFPSWERRN